MVYALVDAMLHFVVFEVLVCVLDVSVTVTTAIIFIEITLIPSLNNSDLIWKEL